MRQGAHSQAHELIHLTAARRATEWLFFLCGFAGASVATRIPSWVAQLHMEEQTLGLVLLCGALGALVSFRLAPALIGSFGYARVAAGSGLALCGAVIAPAWATNAWFAGMALMSLGAISGLLNVSMNLSGAQIELRLGRPVMSGLHGLCSLGSLAGAAIGAWAAHATVTMTMHLVGTGLMALPLTWLAGCFLPREQIAEPSGRPASPPTSAWGEPLRTFGFVALLSSVGEGAMADWIALYLTRYLASDAGAAALGYVTFSISMVVGRMSGDALWGQQPVSWVLKRASALATIGLGLGLLLNTFFAILVASACVGFGLGPTVPCILRATSRAYPAHASEAFARVASIAFGGFLIGPPLIGFVAQRGGLRLGLTAVVLSSAGIAVTLILAERNLLALSEDRQREK